MSDSVNEITADVSAAKRQALISGASFAGLATAWWLRRLGYEVTIVEIASGLRKGGTPIDIRDEVVAVVKRMGLLERIAALALPPRSMEFLRADGSSVAKVPVQAAETEGWEIERDVLLDLMFEQVRNEVVFRFDDSISAIREDREGISVEFTSGHRGTYAFLFGCDGTHSTVRRLCFGDESQYLLFLKMYFSLSVVGKELTPPKTTEMMNLPGKLIMLNGYPGKADLGLCFASDEEISYDRHDQQEQRSMIAKNFEEVGWRTPELLQEMWSCENFYFDKLCQIRMPTWSKGRVALVGDAGYCPSPAAGMGGSMALLGAAAIADGMEAHPEDFAEACKEYERSLRPVVERVQAAAVRQAERMLNPMTADTVQDWSEE